jgi:ATP-dependent phosphofructokinase / diphosphate-dependent phosphofructokinase
MGRRIELRYGVLTGGGDCPGLNPAIRAVVLGLNGDAKGVGFHDGLNGLLGDMSHEVLTMQRVRDIGRKGGTILGSASEGPWTSKVADGKNVGINPQVLEEAATNLDRMGIDSLIVIGGDGTLNTAKQLADYAKVNIVGIPKTIDNDVKGTDFAIGFQTAVDRVVEALGYLQTTADSHHRVCILETMGRNTGWIALEGGRIGNADVICIPEIPPNPESIVRSLHKATKNGYHSSLVAVAEGVSLQGGGQVLQQERIIAENRLGGVADVIEREIEMLEPGKFKMRVSKLGHIQRGGPPVTADIDLAQDLAFEAVNAIRSGHSGVVVKRGRDTLLVPFEEIAGGVRKVDSNSRAVALARSLGITFGDNYGRR